MKKVYIFSSLLLLFLLVTSSSYKTAVLNAPPPPGDTTILVLPEISYEYKYVPFPEHALIGGWEPIDTSTIGLITNNGATLGRVLFYDNIMSANLDQSCGSCHKQEFALGDNVDFSEGFEGELTVRNTPHLNDLGWGPVGNGFFWDMSISSLEELVVLPVVNPNELGLSVEDLIDRLNDTDYYPPLFEAAFGSSIISEPLIKSALSQFIASYRSFESKFDKGVPSGFTEYNSSELAGKDLFDINCTICHSTPSSFVTGNPQMGLFAMGNNGLDETFTDLGMGAWTGDSFFNGLFKSPSLKNIAFTAPYMHDGRFESLEEVIDFYSEDIQPNENSAFNWFQSPDFTGFNFSDSDKENLVAFLHTLSDENLLANPKWSNPFQTITTSTDDIPETLLTARLYPNPMADYTVLHLNNPSNEELSLRLNTIDGKQVRQWNASGEDISIARKDLEAGIYFLTLTQDGQTRSLKLVVR